MPAVDCCRFVCIAARLPPHAPGAGLIRDWLAGPVDPDNTRFGSFSSVARLGWAGDRLLVHCVDAQGTGH